MLGKKLPVICNITTQSKKINETKKTNKTKKKDGMSTFPNKSYWKIFTPNKEVVKEPLNYMFINPRAPTIQKQDAQFVLSKYNFDWKLERPPFTGKKEIST